MQTNEQVRAAALEEAALICDQENADYPGAGPRRCATRIRALATSAAPNLNEVLHAAAQEDVPDGAFDSLAAPSSGESADACPDCNSGYPMHDLDCPRVPAAHSSAPSVTRAASNAVSAYYDEHCSAASLGNYMSDLRAALAAPTGESLPVTEGWSLVPVKISDEMIEGALVAHYGKHRLGMAGGPNGMDMTVNDVNYSGAQAMRRLWKGALAAAPAPTGASK